MDALTIISNLEAKTLIYLPFSIGYLIEKVCGIPSNRAYYPNRN